jgi:hypothetical protein
MKRKGLLMPLAAHGGVPACLEQVGSQGTQPLPEWDFMRGRSRHAAALASLLVVFCMGAAGPVAASG